MKEKRKSKSGRNPKLDPAVYRYTVRFNEEEHNRFLAMFGKSGVYARSVFLKAHFFGQPFKVLKVDKTLVDYYTKLSDFHAQFRAVGTNYNQVVKELRLHFSEKKAMEVVSKRWHNLFYILQFCYIFFWLCCFFLMHLATSCYIPIISGYK
ncbi:conjugal transfer protein MobA [Parabacteroides distasonis]|uniref:conjugal transfer protein MobA n=2 Tax=Bacteroidales TaxID=171549 RepID=UPI00374E1371